MNWKNILLIIVLLTFVASLVKTMGNISDGKKRLAEVKSEVVQTIKQKEDLEAEIKVRESPTYLEREARNRLNLVKPGERIVILPRKPDSVNSVDSLSAGGGAQSKSSEPNWVKWKKLFFN